MSNSKSTRKQHGPRGSKDDVDSVLENAAAAGRVLDAEQAESVGQLAQALEEISEGEALAHLDSRLAFVERQVERLASRRDEGDRGIQGELAVMRARIEDALEAVGATAEQQKEALSSLEKRLASVVVDAQRSSTDVVGSLRQEIVAKVQETAGRLEKLDARVRGEMKAFQEGFDERSRTMTKTIAEEGETLESRLAEEGEIFESRLAELGEGVKERTQESVAAVEKLLAQQTESHSGAIEEIQAQFEESRSRMVTDITARIESLESRAEAMSEEAIARVREAGTNLENLLGQVEQRSSDSAASAAEARAAIEKKAAEQAEQFERRFAELSDETAQRLAAESAQVSEQVRAETAEVIEEIRGYLPTIEGQIEGHRAGLEEQMIAEKALVDERLSGQEREMGAQLSEWGAEVRMESQRLRESVEARSKTVAEALEVVRRDLLTRVQASEERAAGAAIRLQSLLDQQKREIVSDEEEWSGLLQEVGEDLSELKISVEELSGRVSTSEARRASDRGSSSAGVEGLSARLEALEQNVREAVEEMVAKQGTRLEMLASQVAGLSESEVAAEEQLGAVDYLKRRVGEMAERVDEIVVKVNAIGRYVTKPGAGARLRAEAALPPDLDGRLAAIEKAIEQLAESQTVPSVSEELLERIERLEHATADLSEAMAEQPEQITFVAQPPPAPDRGVDLSVRVDEPRRSNQGTILPRKKRRW